MRRDKPMMVCEKRKSPEAYSAIKTATELADNPNGFLVLLADERGHMRESIVVTYSTQRHNDLMFVLKHRSSCSREHFQLNIGRLLGYSDESCANFSHSAIGKSCACELCGGGNGDRVEERAKKRQLHDEHVRRTMYHAK